MNGIHDLGGRDGFGSVEVEEDEPVFHEPWEGRVFGMKLVSRPLLPGATDAARHAVERIAPQDYLALSYYGRWLRAFEIQLQEYGYLSPGEIEAHMAGQTFEAGAQPGAPPPENGEGRRERTGEPKFSIGQKVRTRNIIVSGHNRLPSYARAHRGTIALIHPDSWVLPDTRAHGRGENPGIVYAVRFAANELWGDESELGFSVHVDLWESYLEAED